MDANPAIDAEDGTHRRVDVDVGGAIKRIEQDCVFAGRVFRRDRDDILIFL
jgi:hypothetical protein